MIFPASLPKNLHPQIPRPKKKFTYPSKRGQNSPRFEGSLTFFSCFYTLSVEKGYKKAPFSTTLTQKQPIHSIDRLRGPDTITAKCPSLRRVELPKRWSTDEEICQKKGPGEMPERLQTGCNADNGTKLLKKIQKYACNPIKNNVFLKSLIIQTKKLDSLLFI